MILGLCDRWGVPPSVIEAEDADRLLSLLAIVRVARPDTPPEAPEEDWPGG